MNIKLFVLVLLAFSSGFAITGVTAQTPDNEQMQEEGTEETNEVLREVGDNVVVRNIEWNFNDESVVIQLDSDTSERITITDALITSDRTTALNRERFTIDGPTTVTFELNEYSRKMGFTIDAGGELQPFMESDSLFDFTDNYSSEQLLIGIAFGGLFGSVMVFGVAYKKQMKLSTKVERVT